MTEAKTVTGSIFIPYAAIYGPDILSYGAGAAAYNAAVSGAE
jgi:hypothetical protein